MKERLDSFKGLANSLFGRLKTAAGNFLNKHDKQGLICIALIILYFLPFVSAGSMFRAAIGKVTEVNDTTWGIQNAFGSFSADYSFKIGPVMFIFLILAAAMYFVHLLQQKRKSKRLLAVNMGLGIVYLWIYHYILTRCIRSYTVTIVGYLIAVLVIAHIILNFLNYEEIKKTDFSKIKIKKTKKKKRKNKGGESHERNN